MRLVFAGTPAFAASALEAIVLAGHQVECVLTQPDRPAGRGLKLQASPVKQYALEQGIPVLQPTRLRSGDDADAAMAVLRDPAGNGPPDVMVVAAYGLILPLNVLQLPRHGCLNIHASLLPRWRGAAPIHRAIEAGDAQTGITIMQMDEGLDTGDICRMASIEIGNDTTGELHDRLARLGATEIVQALDQLQHSVLTRTPQPSQGVTYASKIVREEARIDWTQPAAVIRNRVMAFDPFPGAASQLMPEAVDVKLFQPQVQHSDAESGNRLEVTPGRILNLSTDGLVVECGDGQRILFAQAQRAGGRRMAAHLALQGLVAPGVSHFDTGPDLT